MADEAADLWFLEGTCYQLCKAFVKGRKEEMDTRMKIFEGNF